jgi:hypothetical protein
MEERVRRRTRRSLSSIESRGNASASRGGGHGSKVSYRGWPLKKEKLREAEEKENNPTFFGRRAFLFRCLTVKSTTEKGDGLVGRLEVKRRLQKIIMRDVEGLEWRMGRGWGPGE